MSSIPKTMQAVLVHQFGEIEQLHLEQVPVPAPGMGQVLVEVRAAGVGPWDSWVRAGKSALHQPLPLIPGSDISGVIVALGEGVDEFEIGEAVFGVTNGQFTGGYAEYALADAGTIAAKPPALAFIEAAALPVVAVTAWTMVRELGAAKAGERVLIHGGAGNVGAYAVQFAKRVGAHVIATALAADVPRVKDLGADEVIDVTTTDFTAAAGRIDVVIDTVGGETLARSVDLLGPGGRIVSSVSQPDKRRAAERGATAQYFIVAVTRDRLNQIGAQLSGLQILIGDVLGLPDSRLAHEMLSGRPHKAGKIILSISQEKDPSRAPMHASLQRSRL